MYPKGTLVIYDAAKAYYCRICCGQERFFTQCEKMQNCPQATVVSYCCIRREGHAKPGIGYSIKVFTEFFQYRVGQLYVPIVSEPSKEEGRTH